MWEVWSREYIDICRVGLRFSITAVYRLYPFETGCIVIEENGEYYSYFNGPHFKTLKVAQWAEIEDRLERGAHHELLAALAKLA